MQTDTEREAWRARRQLRKEQGICVRCGRVAVPGKTLCPADAEKYRLDQQSRKSQIAAYKKTIRHLDRARKRQASCRERRNERRRERMRTDPAYAMAHRLRKRIGRAIRDKAGRGAKKETRTAELIGCTTPQLMAHLESLFLLGMSWENRHLWHIDHVLPCAAFDLTNPKEQRRCFHYTNLQPLWALDNIKKRAKCPNGN